MLIVAIRVNVGLEDFERRLSRARSTATPTIPTNSPSCRVCCTSALGHRSTTHDLLPVPLAPFLLPLNNTSSRRFPLCLLIASVALAHIALAHVPRIPILSNLIGADSLSSLSSYSSPFVLRVLGAKTSTYACFFSLMR